MSKSVRAIFISIGRVFISAIFILTAGCNILADPYANPNIETIADGLLSPVGMTLLPDGSLLVAEEGTGQRDHSAGVSLITPDGNVNRLISGFASSRDAGDLAGVNFVALSPDQQTIYIGHFNDGHLWTFPATEVIPTSLREEALTPDNLTPAVMQLNNVYLVNPFDMTFDAQGVPVITDASGNGVAKENPDGTTRFIHRFEPLPNPVTPSDTIDAVPTGITRIADEYYVTLTGGCPYPENSGLLVAIDENRNQRTIIDGLNMPIDVTRGPDGTIWLLEFARFTPDATCFDGQGYQPNTGRLSRLDADGKLIPVLTNLNFPAAVLAGDDGTLYISSVFTGELWRVTF